MKNLLSLSSSAANKVTAPKTAPAKVAVTPIQLAPSRLKAAPAQITPTLSSSKYFSPAFHSRKNPAKTTSDQSFKVTMLGHAYFRHLPLLIAAAFSYSGVFFILKNIYPDQLRNLVISGSYSPIIGALFVAHFFCFSYLTLNTRRGLLVSLFLTSLTHFQLQQILSTSLVVATTFYFGVFEVLLSLLQGSHNSEKSNSPHSPSFVKTNSPRGGIISYLLKKRSKRKTRVQLRNLS